MADITYSNRATERRGSPGVVPGKGDAFNEKVLVCSTIELAASASGTTIFLGRIPSNARILPDGLIANDDLATSGSPTLDIGLASVDSNITSSPTAISNGQSLSAATNTVGNVLTDPASAGKMAWELAGASSDPGGMLDVYGSVKDAATTATGSITVILKGFFD